MNQDEAEKRSSDEEDAELKKRKAEEYEMQLFGLHSGTVCAAINCKVKENIDTRCHKMYESIEKRYNPDITQKELLKKNIRDLRKRYRHNMEPHLKTIENIVHKFINIPDNVLLDGDKCQATQYSDEEIHILEKKLEHLQQEAKRATIFNAALKEELQTAERIRETIKVAKKLCNIVDKGLSAKKLSNKTVRAVEKVKGLREPLDFLQPCTEKDMYNPKCDQSNLEQIFLK